LLDLTRIIRGKIELAREPADLSSLVQSAFAESLSTAEELRIKMELSLPTASSADRRPTVIEARPADRRSQTLDTGAADR